jgi:hypothetical protein
LKYAGWCLGLAVLLVVVQVAFHAIRSDPRDPRAYAERQLKLSALHTNERILAEVSVWQRPAIDYFQATRGLLVLTDAPPRDSIHPVGGRLIYLGLEPRDPMSGADAPPTFDERDWPIDTLAPVFSKRTLFYLSRGLSVGGKETRLALGVPSPATADAETLLKAAAVKYAELRRIGFERREKRRAADREKEIIDRAGRREWFHVVRRGEAVASIARMFNTTPEHIRALNALSTDKIRIGDKLRVKEWTKKPVTFPPGVVPDTV